ncbi:hypothetical protein A3844_14755 [Paenibacillus helianthi]|uniref:Acetyltransferase (GNAT) domain-containing protein n=1 Tax=Paenibacillus helianthi TaxID=1349432 RepID=A0ABX3EQN7_9BACL|nr:hypothetical protein [Paenibacillus helianthi]OKP86011.1 hypothetical protein A3844_14755 [Paenibacillus helianthi]
MKSPQNVLFMSSSYYECRRMFLQYLESLSGVYDNFLEDHILDSNFYEIRIDGAMIGYFAIHKDVLLTQFYIQKRNCIYAQSLFDKVIKEYSIETAYVPTCDELFLSLCIENHKEIEIQAFIFEESGVDVRPPEFSKSNFRLVSEDRWAEVNEITRGFFEEINTDKVKKDGLLFEIYELSVRDEVLGYGLREEVRVFTDYNATGMYVMPEHREKGAGRSIIIYLKNICAENGKKPLPGCWYYNHNSKSTLESSGFVSKTRLLKVSF